LLVLAACAFALSATGLGSWLADNYIVPYYERAVAGLGGGAPGVPPGRTPEATTRPSAPAQQAESAQLTLTPRPFITIQMASFTSREAAQTEAGIIAARGGAGYIYEDNGRFRVLAALYRTEADAKQVRDNLRTAQGIDSYIYIRNDAPLTLTITATPQRQRELEDAFAAYCDTIDALMSLAERIDRSQLTPDEVPAQTQALAVKLAPHAQAVAAMQSAPGDHDALGGIAALLSASEAALEEFDEPGATKNVAVATSRLKYDALELLALYGETIGNL
jgi:hypothetical protein